MLHDLNIERVWATERNKMVQFDDVVESSAGTRDRGENRWGWAGVMPFPCVKKIPVLG